MEEAEEREPEGKIRPGRAEEFHHRRHRGTKEDFKLEF
jgi:hypothetical protein